MWSEHCSYKSSKVHLRQFGEKVTDEMRAHLMVGHGRERRRRRHRPGLRRHVQGRVAQPPVVRRALPGRRDRGRRHRPRHPRDGRPAGRGDGPAALRAARRRRHPARAARDRRRRRRLRQLPRPAQHRRRGGLRRDVPRQPAGQRALRRRHAPRAAAPRQGVRRRQPGHPVRRPHRRRRHRRRLGAGQRDLRAPSGPGEAAERPGRRPVHGEAAHRVHARALRRGARRRHPGPRRRRAVLRDVASWRRPATAACASGSTGCRCATPRSRPRRSS